MMKRYILLTATHILTFISGFALGIYVLPILTAPPSLDSNVIAQKAESALLSAEFTKDLRGSDFLHWGEGTISITANQIVYQGDLAPGPDYKLYLVPEFVEHEDEFLPIKQNAQIIGDIKTFDGFVLDIPGNINIEEYNTVLVWCEAFSEFITAAQYR